MSQTNVVDAQQMPNARTTNANLDAQHKWMPTNRCQPIGCQQMDARVPTQMDANKMDANKWMSNQLDAN